MNKNAENIVYAALNQLENVTGIKGKYYPARTGNADGEINLQINGRNVKFPVEIKKELRQFQLPDLIALNRRVPYIIVAERIFPALKEQLQKNKIGYLDGAGNIFLQKGGVHLHIEGHKNEPQKIKVTNRTFTKTGLRVLFQLLVNEDALNWPYRKLAAKAGVALGNINYVITGLNEMGFILRINEREMKLVKKKELLDRWIDGFETTLKPDVYAGGYNFIKDELFKDWKKLRLDKGLTVWGGEPAADILTNYLRPGEWTLYTEEDRPALMKKYKLVPDTKGKIKVYKKFWTDPLRQKDNIVDTLLIYADLLITRDPRCIEVAQMINKKYLDGKFD